MHTILIVGDDPAVLHSHAGPLDGAGYHVEIATEVFRARDRLAGEPCDIVVIDARSPDGGTGLLIEQARAAWPGCSVLALVQRPDLRRTKVHEMGLWTPDATLVHPVAGEELVSAVAALAEPGGEALDSRSQGAVL